VAAETELGGSAPLEPPTRIRSWLDALVHAMPRIDSRAHVVLIETVLSITWTALDESCIGPYIHFVAALLGAKPEFVGLVVKRAVKGFHYSAWSRALR
jgi:RNA polymerase I-specific transcription initiation factor RRN3